MNSLREKYFRMTLLFVSALLLLLLSGCAKIQPWVKPWERGQLSEPAMQLSRNPLADKFRQHVFDTREGARGAAVTRGGGCGCQ